MRDHPAGSRTADFKRARRLRYLPVRVLACRNPSGSPHTRSYRRRACSRPHIYNMIGNPDDVRIMLHDDDCISLIPKLLRQAVHVMHIVRMQANAGLVKIYVKSVKSLPSWRTILMRWDSPPDSLAVSRSIVR